MRAYWRSLGMWMSCNIRGFEQKVTVTCEVTVTFIIGCHCERQRSNLPFNGIGLWMSLCRLGGDCFDGQTPSRNDMKRLTVSTSYTLPCAALDPSQIFLSYVLRNQTSRRRTSSQWTRLRRR